jgi:hypothetical protein
MDEVNRSLVDWGYGPPPQEEAPEQQAEEQAAASEVH